ncbi:MAG TPA: efflux RND transporter periplasmic adaptor subunit [Ideonella sp.]|nr:efflux RND transporter periplasmic adaptor subunit [Ideonella sp.]
MIRDTAAQDRPVAAPPALRRRLLWASAALAVLGCAAFAWPSLRQLASTGTSVSVSRLSLAAVEKGLFVRDLAAEGKVVAANSPTLFAANGGAATLKVHAGDTVKKGQVLVAIDSPELAAKLAQELSNADAMRADHLRAQVDARQQRSALQSAWDNAAIDLKTAQNDLARQQKAFEAGAAAGMQVDHARDTLEKAQVTLANAKAGLGLSDDSLKFNVQTKQLAHERQLLLVKDLQRQVEELQVRSPVDGQVGQLFIAERANIAKDARLLSVIDLSALEVQMQVAESFARDLAIGMPGEIGGNGGHWAGKVSAISPEVVNNEVAARLRFDGDTPGQLRQNQRLSVRVMLDRRDGVLTVRRGSFVDESGGAYAYVVRDGVAEKTAIRVGARSIDKVEILQGLAPGDQIVIAGAESFQGASRVALSR